MGVGIKTGVGAITAVVVAAGACGALVGWGVGDGVTVGANVAVGLEAAAPVGVRVASGVIEIPDPPHPAAKIPKQVNDDRTRRPRPTSIRRSCRRRWSGLGR